MNFIKKQLPLTVCFVIGTLCFAQYYVPARASQDFLETMNGYVLIMAFFAYFLGMYSIFAPNLRKIANQADGWGYSVVLFLGVGIGVATGLLSHARQMAPDGSLTSFGWMYNYMYYPLNATMYSLLGFFIVSTSFRAFRVKGGPALVLFISAVILIFGRVPLGQMLWAKFFGWTHVSVSQIVEWVMNYPVIAGKRGIMIGIALGSIAASIKIIAGIEKQYLGGD
ncbi:MAG: hypothetical protein WCS77_01805 [Elusimicrobiaceae bacterium]